VLQVDVVLDEDRGFWHAIETFMNITKRPIVLTASDSQFISRFTGRVESIRLHTPQLVDQKILFFCIYDVCGKVHFLLKFVYIKVSR